MMQPDLVCSTCRGTDFYEDRQGNYTCQRCGALSQDYFAESYEFDDVARGTRGLRTIKSKTTKRVKEDIEPITSIECITVYQACLQSLAQIVARLISSEQYMEIVKKMWFEYLTIWQWHGWSMQTWFSRSHRDKVYNSTAALDRSQRKNNAGAGSVASLGEARLLFDGAAFSSASEETEGNNSESDDDKLRGHKPNNDTEKKKRNVRADGLAPSKPLLLGFLYLACRQLRSWVIPADIVRWCATGVLPVVNLWASDCIPAAYRHRLDSLRACPEKRVFTAYFRSATSLPTVSNVFFQSIALAKMLSVPYPPLNAPLVARRLICSLGLPDEVWAIYVEIGKLKGSMEVPIAGADPFEEHHAENIGAAVLLACRLCPSWPSWCLHKLPSSVVSFNEDHVLDGFAPPVAPMLNYPPLRTEDVCLSLHKDEISAYIQHVSKIVLPSALRDPEVQGKCNYNNILQNFFAEADCGKKNNNRCGRNDDNSSINAKVPIWMSGRAAMPAPRSQLEERAAILGVDFGKRVHKSKSDEAKDVQKRLLKRRAQGGAVDDIIYTYALCPLSDQGETDQQYTVLLERVARSIGAWPGDLHDLLQQLETKVSAVALCEVDDAMCELDEIALLSDEVDTRERRSSIDDDKPISHLMESCGRKRRREE